MRERRKWAVMLLVLVASAVILAVGIKYIKGVQDSFWLQSVTDVREVTVQGGHAFDVYITKDMEMLHGLALNLSQKDSDDRDSIMNRLLAFGEGEKNYFVVDKDRGVVYSSRTGGDRELDGEYLAAVGKLSGQGILEPYMEEDTGRKMLGLYESFTFADGTEGVIFKDQELSHVADEFSLSFYNNTGFSYIVNQKGDILIRSVHRNSNRTFLNVFDIIELEGNSEEVLEDFKESLAEGKSGVARFYYGQEEYVFAYDPLEVTDGWYLISMIPNRVIMQQAEHVLKSSQIFAFIFVIVLLSVGVVALLMWQNHKNVMEKVLEIRYREQLFGILASNTEDVYILVARENHRVEYVSPNIERVLGILPEEVKADITVLETGRAADAPEEDYERVFQVEAGEVFSREGERTHKKTGEQRWFFEKVHRVIIDDADKFIVTLSDRTAEKQREQTLEQALEIAEVANQSKSTFLSNMSHDIRTPMNAVVGLCTLLERDADNGARVREYTKKITASSQHLLGLINDVLDMSKIEAGKTTLNISEINLAELVDGLETIIRPQAKAKKQTFEITVFDVNREQLLGDKLRINQILINILSNAVKYTEIGGKVEMMIRQLPQTTKNYVCTRFIVKDNGIGMSEEYIRTIFQPFTREVNSTTNQVQGTGLGMAITKNLVDLMGGTILVDSISGQGSTFTIDLELRIQEQDIDQDFWKKYGVVHILIVDDEAEVCTGIISAMAGTGVSMQFAVNGESAVKMVDREHRVGRDFDLVLLDLRMPGMDGIETARRIREIVPKDIPIIILTANDWSDIEYEARAVGVDGFLQKPFFLFNFKQMIENLREQEQADIPSELLGGVFAGRHILAAEDNELNSEILVELLEMAGAECDVAENGREALEMFEKSGEKEYDIILMDVQMPVMDGYEATRQIRACAHPAAAEIPIVAMTANAFAEDVKNALDAGMDAHIAKPIDMEKLEATIKDIYRQKYGGGGMRRKSLV